MMRIWRTDDKSMVLTEMTDELCMLNIVTEEYISGFGLTRSELERLCLGLLEWCGIPTFNRREVKGDFNESHDDGSSDGEK